MKQQIKAVLDDERGVSPVIGVILMVAITVILAAVIGTFVLGLGDSLNQAPQAQLDAEANSNDNLVLSHNGGDSIPLGDVRIEVNGDDSGESNSITSATDSDGDSEFSVGDSLTNNNGGTTYTGFGDTRIQVIHVPSESIILDTEVSFTA